MIKTLLLTILILLFLGCDSNNTISEDTPTTITEEIDEEPTTSNDVTDAEDQSTVEQEDKTSVTANNSRPMLAILLSYNNVQISSSATIWSAKLFGKQEGQLNHYYLEASQNNFEFEKMQENQGVVNDGVVSVQLNKNHPNINIDSSSFDSQVHPDLAQALESLDSLIDFSNYDNNADGFISSDELLFTFIIAGYEDAYERTGHVTNGIWAHQSCVSSSRSPTLDAVSLMNCNKSGNFALFGERHDKSAQDGPTHDATIGIIAHELGHSTFDLPDLYNISNSYSGGIGNFGLMGAGTWTSKNSTEYYGNTPTHFTAWSKIFNGWINPVVESSTTGFLNESSSLEYNIIKLPINSTSYYLLENRNNSGYDRGLYSLTGQFKGGVAIWKIDETQITESDLTYNTVNTNTNNKGVDLVEAVYRTIDSDGDGGDEDALYYEGNVNSFSSLVTNISQRGSTMSLTIK